MLVHAMRLTHKVLFLTDSLSSGGAERQLVLLLKYLPEDWECKVWSLDNGAFLHVIQEMGIPTQVAPRRFRYDFMPFLRLWRLILQERPNLIHTWGWLSLSVAVPICRILHIPVVDSAIRSGTGMPPLRRIVSNWADLLIANSQAGIKASGIDRSRVRVIYNGFDAERLERYQRENTTDLKRTTVVMTGRMVREKDFDLFLSVARLLNQKEPRSWKFLAIGKGPDRERLISSSKELIDYGCIDFPEAGLEVLGFLQQANIGVLLTNASYHAEGLSNSIMEYMACGLPVICNRNGGNEELVLEGETGFLIEPGDSTALMERLLYFHQNPEAGQQMGMCGKERIREQFSVEKMVSSLISAYQEALA